MSTRDEPRSVRAAPTPAASSPRRAPSPTGGSPKKKRLEKERQIAQHRLIRADAPIVGNVGATAVRQESPCGRDSGRTVTGGRGSGGVSLVRSTLLSGGRHPDEGRPHEHGAFHRSAAAVPGPPHRGIRRFAAFAFQDPRRAPKGHSERPDEG